MKQLQTCFMLLINIMERMHEKMVLKEAMESVNINRWMEVSEGHEVQVNSAAISAHIHTSCIPSL